MFKKLPQRQYYGPKQKNLKSEKIQKVPVRMIPINIQIGPDIQQTIPQYSSTEIRLIEVLVRSMRSDIPQNEKLYMVNWTKGRNIGRALSPEDTIESLLVQSQQQVPTIRVYWQNCPTYYVKVDLQDILILQYPNVELFHQIIDLINFVKADVRKAFKLDKNMRFGLKIIRQFKEAEKLAFVGRYFDPNKINIVEMVFVFKQELTTEFVKAKQPGKYQHLICPISQMIIQDPVVTVCGHHFDRLCICLTIWKDNKCPVCRHRIQMQDLKSARKLKLELRNLKNLRYQQQMKKNLKKQQQQNPQN